MAMKRCPVCGEMYSDTYKYCPFCEEDEILQERKDSKTGGGRRSTQAPRFNLLTPVLIVLILVMVWLLVYLIWGNPIVKKPDAGGLPQPAGSETVEPGGEDGAEPVTPGGEDGGAPTGGDGVMPSAPEDMPPPAATEYEKAASLPSGISLNKTDYTTKVGDAPVQLKASGGSGSYTWVSEDPSVASVDSTGKVVAMSAGTVNVLATDGSKKGVCIVRVKAGSGVPNTGTDTPAPPSGGTEPTPSGGSSKLAIANSGGRTLPMSGNQYDCTIAKGSSAALHVTGTTESVTWTSANSSIATVSATGNVTGVASGTTTVTAAVGGESLSVIIRVS